MSIKSENLQWQLKKGRHSVVYLVENYAVKFFKKQFEYNFFKEVKFLTLLQPFGFVPKLYFIDPENLMVVMQRLEGKKIRDCINLKLAVECLKICFLLDMMGIQKEEMNHPDKHIIVADRVYLIDFERSHFSSKPSNLTQFCIYLRKLGYEVDGELLKCYKRSFSYDIFKKILEKLAT
jgi:putative serine/threonine protein kinase